MKTAEDSPLNYRFLATDHVETGTLPLELIAGLVILPINHAAYFDLSVPHQIISLDKLVASRARPKGVANANIYMRQAAAGQPRRLVCQLGRSIELPLQSAEGIQQFARGVLGWCWSI